MHPLLVQFGYVGKKEDYILPLFEGEKLRSRFIEENNFESILYSKRAYENQIPLPFVYVSENETDQERAEFKIKLLNSFPKQGGDSKELEF